MTDRGFPLAGLRVLDLSRVLAGPVCCQLLADLGADVVKVERPGTGDDTRAWGPPFLPHGGPSAYYLSCNRGKRSLTLDLGHADAPAVLDDLIRRADVLVENFLPDALDKFGLRPQRLAELNPRLVSCSISGYGRTGPLVNAPGYDLMIQATAGLMSITGEPDGAPMKTGVAISDVLTGLYAAASALAGLWGRDRGPWAFDLALADCTLASLVNVAQSALVTGSRPVRYGNAHPQIVPYEVFAAADGHFVLAIGNDGQWRRFCRAVDREAWANDPRFETNPRRVENRQALVELLRPLLAARTIAQWQALLGAAEAPHAPILAIDEIVRQPQTLAREMVLPAKSEAWGEFSLLGGAAHWEGEPARRAAPPPELGADTDAVLCDWLDYTAARIAALRRGGALG
jgi:crotonobetainyl-CoA:carnitine CoA-transferase CaiB-like acyl-CoA transferase